MPSEMVVIGLDRLTLYQARIAHPETVIREVVAEVVERHGKALEQELSREPGPPVYPILWTSRRQKIAFKLTFGFGRGIPTVRQHLLSTAWLVASEETARGILSIGVINFTFHRQFVTGRRQQIFHKITGWVNEQAAFATTRAVMTQDFISTVRQRFTPA
jgi:hypothetical protein